MRKLKSALKNEILGSQEFDFEILKKKLSGIKFKCQNTAPIPDVDSSKHTIYLLTIKIHYLFLLVYSFSRY